MQSAYKPKIMIVGKEHHIRTVVANSTARRIGARYEAFNSEHFTLPVLLRAALKQEIDALVFFAAALTDHGIRLLRFVPALRERRSVPRVRMFVILTNEQRTHRPRTSTYMEYGVEATAFIANLNDPDEVSREINNIIGRLLPPSNT